MEADYIGLDIPDEFFIGYGLDYIALYRSLTFIGVPAKYAIQRYAH